MTSTHQKTAVVTGASSGIGAATVRALTSSGWDVVAVARRRQMLESLAEETGARMFVCDVTVQADVDALVQFLGGAALDALVNNAGGAFGVDLVDSAVLEDWQHMYDVNVLGAVRMTKALLPFLRADGGGSVLYLTSTAGHAAYEGGAGYCAAKFAERSLANTLRLEEAENKVRVIEVAPGMVQTEEFSLNRLHGDRAAADRVYEGVEFPLTADDVAGVVAYSLNLPQHVNLDTVVVRPLAQAANHKLVRTQ